MAGTRWQGGAADDVPTVQQPRSGALRVLLIDPAGAGSRVRDQALANLLPVTTRLVFRRSAAAPALPVGGSWADNVFVPAAGWVERIPAGTDTLWGSAAALPPNDGVPAYTPPGVVGAPAGGFAPTPIGPQSVSLPGSTWVDVGAVIPAAAAHAWIRVDLAPVRGIYHVSLAQWRALAVGAAAGAANDGNRIPLERAWLFSTPYFLGAGRAAGDRMLLQYDGGTPSLPAFTVQVSYT